MNNKRKMKKKKKKKKPLKMAGFYEILKKNKYQFCSNFPGK
jgi:hypothetical protein